MLYENTDFYARTWTHLTDKATGRTVHLAPGERCEIDTPDDFTDPFLRAVPKPKKTHTTTEAATPADPEGVADNG